MIDNAVSYQDTAWIIDNSDYGLFLLIAPHKMQGEVLAHFEGSNIAVFNCLEKADRTYSFNELELWIQNNPDKNAYFVQNFQALFLEQQDIHDNLVKFNFSRDMLIRLRKNIIFCVDRATDDLLDRNAFDVYSYFKLKPEFEDDAPELPETPVSWDSGLDAGQTTVFINKDESRKKLLGQAITYMNQAQMFIEKAQYMEAMNLLAAAMKIREKELGEEHPDTAETYDAISLVYASIYDYEQALRYAKKARNVREIALGSVNIKTAVSYNNIACIYDHMGNYDNALELYNKALDIDEKLLGIDHPSTVMVYNNIATVYSHLGEYSKAIDLFSKVIDIREKKFGIANLETVTSYNHIAMLYDEMCDYRKALEWYNKALAVLEKLYGAEYKATLKEYNIIAHLYGKMGDQTNAYKWYLKAGKGREIGNETDDNTDSDIRSIRPAFQKQTQIVLKTKPYIIRSRNKERIVIDKPVFRIGRERSSVDYYIDDNYSITRNHCNIITKNGEWFIIDNSSTNGTYVNGTKVTPYEEVKLSHGSLIRVSNEEFEFRLY